MRAKITLHEPSGVVTLTYEDDWGERITRLFVGEPGHYVWELQPNGNTTQPCDYLDHTGPTLVAGNSLLSTIRRELARRRTRERRLQKYFATG